MTLTLNQLRNVNDPEKVFQLINWMLSPEPSMRPTSTRVLMDDFFSSSKTRDLELEGV